MFCHEAFFRMYLPLALEVYNRLFIESLGVLVVNEIKKHLLGSCTQSKYSPCPSVLTSPSVSFTSFTPTVVPNYRYTLWVIMI